MTLLVRIVATVGLWFSDSEGTIHKLAADGSETVNRPIGGVIWGLCVTPDGDLWLTKVGPNDDQIIRLSPEGEQRDAIPASGADILVDPSGRVWFLNRLRGTVSRFAP